MEMRSVVVTGASRGIGRAVAMELAAVHGCRVHAVARDPKALDALRLDAQAQGGVVVPVPLDLAAADAAARLSERVGEGRLHALVNVAGLLVKRTFGTWTAEDGKALFHLNTVVPLLLAQVLADRLSGDPVGHILNIGSMGGFQGSAKFPGLALYSASKGGLVTVTECLAEELKERSISCNCLSIGAVDTDMLREAFPGYQAPIGAEAMGAYIARFSLEGHNYFNGKVLPVALSTP